MRITNFLVNSIISHNAKQLMISQSFRNSLLTRNCSSKVKEEHYSEKFETVFSFPFVRHISTLNKMKMYHMFGTALAVPGCGLLEAINVFPEYSFLAASYIGVTGGILLSLASVPFNNAIGFLYISDDNKQIKISSVDFWGRRKDRVISAEDWVPLLDMKPKTLDAIYLSPQLTDGTKYKLFVKFGKVINSSKMGQVIE